MTDPAPRNQLIADVERPRLPPCSPTDEDCEVADLGLKEYACLSRDGLRQVVACRERELLEALTELQRLREENAELTRKGLALCTALGSSLIVIADARIAMERAHQLIENGMEVRAMECLGRAVDALPTPPSEGGSK